MVQTPKLGLNSRTFEGAPRLLVGPILSNGLDSWCRTRKRRRNVRVLSYTQRLSRILISLGVIPPLPPPTVTDVAPATREMPTASDCRMGQFQLPATESNQRWSQALLAVALSSRPARS